MNTVIRKKATLFYGIPLGPLSHTRYYDEENSKLDITMLSLTGLHTLLVFVPFTVNVTEFTA